MRLGRDWKKLSKLRFTDYPVTSAFISLRPSSYRRVPGLVFLKKELSNLKKSVPTRGPEAAFLRRDIAHIQKVVEEAQGQKATSVAVYSSAKKNFSSKLFWSVAPESDLEVADSLVRGFRPNLYPAAIFSDRLENFILLVVDLQKAELFRVEGGMITERRERGLELPAETRRTKMGRYDRSVGAYRPGHNNRVERRQKMQIERYLKAAAGGAVEWCREMEARTVVVGADAVAGPTVTGEIGRRAAGVTPVLAPIDAKLSEPQKLAEGVLAFRNFERQTSHRRVAELLSPGRRQVFWGARSVIDFLQEGKRGVVLVLDRAFHQAAPVCGRCSELLPTEGSCPLCAGPVREASVENELICLAAAAGVEIEFVRDSEELSRKGGVGLLV